MKRRTRFLLACLCLAPLRFAAAQIPFLDALVSHVSEVNFDLGFGKFLSSDQLESRRLRTVGFELTFSVPGLGCVNRTGLARRSDLCAAMKREQHLVDSIRKQCEASDSKVPSDSICAHRAALDANKGVGREVSRRIGDSTVVTKYEPKETDSGNTGELVGITIGVSYDRITGFRSRQAGVDLSGSIEELPAITTYFSVFPDHWIAPYLGVRTGLVRLAGFQGTPTGQPTLEGGGDTYLLGGAVGVAAGNDRVQGFIEYNVTYRHFGSLHWGTDAAVPAVLPRELGASTRGIAVGMQVTIK